MLSFMLWRTGNISRPMTDSSDPHMPRSVIYAIPFGTIRSSDVWTCVSLDNTRHFAIKIPSKCNFSYIASASISAYKICTLARSSCKIVSMASNGHEASIFMNWCRKTTQNPIFMPFIAKIMKSRPGHAFSKLAGQQPYSKSLISHWNPCRSQR
jgi:hypothetical protein